MSLKPGVPSPETVDIDAYLAAVDTLRVREKKHMQASDALAAARRRLPMSV